MKGRRVAEREGKVSTLTSHSQCVRVEFLHCPIRFPFCTVFHWEGAGCRWPWCSSNNQKGLVENMATSDGKQPCAELHLNKFLESVESVVVNHFRNKVRHHIEITT